MGLTKRKIHGNKLLGYALGERVSATCTRESLQFSCLFDFNWSTFVFRWMHLRIISHKQKFRWREWLIDVYDWCLSSRDSMITSMSAGCNVKRMDPQMDYCIWALEIADVNRLSCHQSKQTASAFWDQFGSTLLKNPGRLVIFSRQCNLIVCLIVPNVIQWIEQHFHWRCIFKKTFLWKIPVCKLTRWTSDMNMHSLEEQKWHCICRTILS